MRSRATNILQIFILLTGIIYIFIGVFFFISPVYVLKFFAQNVSENWFDLVRDHELVAPLYYIVRGFAALLFSSGAAMILPLFDPLRYRGLVYYNGIVFPFFACVIFLKKGLFLFLSNTQVSDAQGKVIPATLGAETAHTVILILGIVFLVIFLLNAAGLILTKKLAHEGVE